MTNLLQFLIKAFVAAAPVDGIVNEREEERQKGGEELFKCLFPRAIKVMSARAHGGNYTDRLNGEAMPRSAGRET